MGSPRKKRSKAPPRYYRVQVVLSDKDADIKAWCWNNPGEVGRAFRHAMRTWLNENQPTAPLPMADKPSTAVTEPYTPKAKVDTRDTGQNIGVPEKPAEQAYADNVGQDTNDGSETPPVDATRKSRLKALIDGNREFS